MCALCLMQALFGTSAAQASPAALIGELEARTVENPSQGIAFTQVESIINTRMTKALDQEDSVGWDLNDVPLIGGLLDDEGNIDFGRNFPLSVDFYDIEGGMSFSLGREFSVD
ncbi:MAG: hypothetical protein AAFS06_04585 [Cyanobacteria bacterium J06631_12]